VPRVSVEAGCRAAGDGFDVAGGHGSVAGDDGVGEPSKHHGALGGYTGRDRPTDPGLLVDVLIRDRLPAHGSDGRGDIVERDGLGSGEGVLSACMGVGVEECLNGDRRDVGGVDERLGIAAAGDVGSKTSAEASDKGDLRF
jgi:hypothetical protein